MTDTWWLNPCKAIDASAYEQALARQQQLTKPAGSLGQLEALAVQLAGLQGQVKPSVDHVWIAIFAGDHGVVAEGVSAYPQEVTGQMLHNFVTGGAAISVLARQLDGQLEVVDLGTVNPSLSLPGVRHLNIGAGTANFVKGPAMNVAQGQLHCKRVAIACCVPEKAVRSCLSAAKWASATPPLPVRWRARCSIAASAI